MYWDDSTRERLLNGLPAKLKSRGIPAKQLGERILELDRQWESFDGTNWPFITVETPFAILSPRQALSQGDWTKAGLVFENVKKEIKSTPITKRDPNATYVPGKGWLTCAYIQGIDIESKPYNKVFGDETLTLTRDGIAEGEIGELLRE